jgi:hypothetical protein
MRKNNERSARLFLWESRMALAVAFLSLTGCHHDTPGTNPPTPVRVTAVSPQM